MAAKNANFLVIHFNLWLGIRRLQPRLSFSHLTHVSAAIINKGLQLMFGLIRVKQRQAAVVRQKRLCLTAKRALIHSIQQHLLFTFCFVSTWLLWKTVICFFFLLLNLKTDVLCYSFSHCFESQCTGLSSVSPSGQFEFFKVQSSKVH